MIENLYTEYPELYDAIQAEWDYDRDISFVQARTGSATDSSLLEIGCGTGEHTRRFIDEGFDVTGVDPHEGMLDRAREKCTAEFHRGGLPDIPVDGAFDVVVAIRGVINHVSPSELALSLQSMVDCLADGGHLVFDNSPLPPDGNHPALDVGQTEYGDYARIAQMKPAGDRLDWVSMTFGPGGAFFVDRRKMTPFEDDVLETALSELGLSVETTDGFGPDDHRTVFVCTAD